ncbi:formyltransferase family protein [Campylobacter mucosalis]|uniref:formyltransferase family protein n=1 Tax=Campylobacter mucosalis TaxID=202 RepID=UPI00146FE636|nr:formyltransferase family protein [Campylobacter mucosalis]
MKQNIVIATIKSWNLENFKKLEHEKFNFILIDKKDDLNSKNLEKIAPKFIFFPHWSWIIPDEIFAKYECIIFHTSDLPFGRGGSPVQNLISVGIYKTKITALRATKELDAGDIYLKRSINLSSGSATQIFKKISKIIFFKMIPAILNKNLKPKKQIGEAVTFKRRTAEQSDLETLSEPSLRKIYDLIRMLDGEGYPKAFLKFGNFNIKFSSVKMKNNKLSGRFEIDED